MTDSRVPCDSDCLLNRFHNSTVLNKYGSSQKGLHTRKKKTKTARFGKIQEHVSPLIEATDIIDSVTCALSSSVVIVLQLIVTAVTVSFFVLSCVCRSVSISSLFFGIHNANGHRAARKRVSSRLSRLIVPPSVVYVVVFLFLLLPCTAANHNRSDSWCERTRTGQALATTVAVAAVAKTNVKGVRSNTLNTFSSRNFSMSGKATAAGSSFSPSNSNKRKTSDQIVVSPCSVAKSLNSSECEIDWGDFDQIAELHNAGTLRDPKFNKVKKNDIIRAVSKYSKETLLITHINCSVQIFTVTPDPNSLKTKQLLMNAFAELILSNIGEVEADEDAEAQRSVRSKSEYSKDKSTSQLLLLKQGGFADSVEVKMLGEKEAKVYSLCIGDDLQSIIELTSTGATGVEGWRPLKNKTPTTSIFDEMEQSAIASTSVRSEKTLTGYAGTPESAVGVPMQVDELNHLTIDSQNEKAFSLLEQFHPEEDTLNNDPSDLQQFWEINCNDITSQCGRKVSDSHFEMKLREWSNDGDNNRMKLDFLRRMAELNENEFRSWGGNSRVWLVNVKSKINSGAYDSWLPCSENELGTNDGYWLSDAGIKETADCKMFWEKDESESAYEMLGNPAEATDDELLRWAGNKANQVERERFVKSIARLSDDVLLESYVDGGFVVELKKRMNSFSAKNHSHSLKKKDACSKKLFDLETSRPGEQTMKTDSSGKSRTEGKRKSSEMDEKSGEMALAGIDLKAKLTSYREKLSKSSSKSIRLIVHAPIDQASSHGDKSVILVLFDPGNDLWYLNFDGMKYSCDICWSYLNNGECAPEWISTIQAFDQRMSEYSAKSLMARVGKGGKKTKKLIGFLLQMEKNKCDDDSVRAVLTDVLSYFKKLYAVREKNSAGTILWDYMIENTVGGADGGLLKFLLTKFKDQESIEKQFTTDLAAFFTSSAVFDFGSSWNRFLVDSSIKDLVSEQLGYTSFDGMTTEAKKALYRDYPEKSLPKFDEITRESY